MNKYFKYLRRKLNQAKALFIIKAELKRKGKINVGSSSVPFDNDWFSCDIDILDYNQKTSIALRVGIKELNNQVSYSLGFGIPFKIGKSLNLYLDYALDPGVMNEGIGHLFTFTMENK